MRIEGSGALVAGGASGLGAATVRRLHAAGATVTIADVNAERGEALAAELGERAAFASCDVTREEQVQAAVAAAGELRIAVCCAGVGWAEKTAGRRGPHAFEPFQQVIAINVIGTFNVLRLSAAAMLANEPDGEGERGVCINTASIAAFDGQIGQLAYSASKGGIVGMTLPAARDLAASGIRVVAIAPGLFDTPLLAGLPEETRKALGEQVPHPHRLGRPDEYADLAAHVVENPMLNGEVIRLDGALRMPPR
jgi:NAD(P)-dependent dehydrogenase (short-subunit alcohol dehydrogenase family)